MIKHTHNATVYIATVMWTRGPNFTQLKDAVLAETFSWGRGGWDKQFNISLDFYIYNTEDREAPTLHLSQQVILPTIPCFILALSNYFK